MSKKKKIDKLLHEAHITINNATGTDIPKYKTEEAKREARKLYKKIKDIDETIYNVIKGDL